MKTAIILSGIAVMVFTSSQANNFTNEVVTTPKAGTTVFQNEQRDSFEVASACDTKTFAPVEDQAVVNPETALNVHYQTAIEDVIKEDNKIIESTVSNEPSFVYLYKAVEEIIQENNQIIENDTTMEIHPLYIDRTIEEVIAEDNAIIESNLVTDTQPLDFNTINKNSFAMKQNNKMVGMN